VSHLIKQVLNTIADLGSSRVTLYRVMNSHNGQVLGVYDNGKITLHHNQDIDFKETPFEEIILKKQTNTYPGLLLKRLFDFPSYHETYSGFQCLCIPLYLKENEPVSSVVVLNRLTEGLHENLPSTLAKVVPLIAVIMQTALENDRWIQLATKDILTDLYVCSYFEKRLEDEVQRVRRHGGKLSFILLEIDQFNEINETYGYEKGENILQEVGKIINFLLRQGIDLPCSYHNNFMIMLPNTDVEGAATVADRIQQHCNNQVFLTKEINKKVNITLSAGIADNRNISLSNLTKEDLIERAETMLQAAKEAGKNMVIIWW